MTKRTVDYLISSPPLGPSLEVWQRFLRRMEKLEDTNVVKMSRCHAKKEIERLVAKRRGAT